MKLLITIFLVFACKDQSPETSLSGAEPHSTTMGTIGKTTVSDGGKTHTDSSGKESTSSVNVSLPNVRKGLSGKGCDHGPGDNGAASYFYTELTLNGDNVSGIEEWILFANKKWKQNNGNDCVVRWRLEGSRVDTKACGSCDYGLEMTNTMDMTGSTCPNKMAKGSTGEPIQYDVKLNGDGTTKLYFANTCRCMS